MMIEARAIPEDLSWVLLRPLDEMECAAAGLTGAEAVRASMQHDDESFMVVIDNEPVAFWGYERKGLMAQVVIAWMLTLDAVEPFNYRLARVSKRAVDFMLTLAPTIVVTTHTDHEPACKWLAWLGFTPLHAPDATGLQHMIKRRG